jgi:hypothetical protein
VALFLCYKQGAATRLDLCCIIPLLQTGRRSAAGFVLHYSFATNRTPLRGWICVALFLCYKQGAATRLDLCCIIPLLQTGRRSAAGFVWRYSFATNRAPLRGWICGNAISSSHPPIFSPSHLLTLSSSHPPIFSPSHLLTLSSSHPLIFSLSHLLTLSSSHPLIFSLSQCLFLTAPPPQSHSIFEKDCYFEA